MIHTKRVMMDQNTGMFYCGTYSGEICWNECSISATDVSNNEWSSFYPWEIDELSEMSLEIKEVVEYIE